jgi:integrase/recombinase XerD
VFGLPGLGCFTPPLEREPPMTEMSPLRRRMIEDVTLLNLSPARQRSYVHAVAKFGRFFGHSPAKLGLEDVRTFQVHLVAGRISWPRSEAACGAARNFPVD